MAVQKTHLYLIREKSCGWHKIGITSDWSKRCKQLAVGTKTEMVLLVRVHNANQLEKRLHKRYHAVRLPQSEWFNLDAFQLASVEAIFHQAAGNYQAALEAKQQQTQLPITPAPTAKALQAVPTGERSTVDQVRKVKAQQQAEQAAAYHELIRQQQQQAERVTAQTPQRTASLPELLSVLAVLAVFPIALSVLFSGLEQARLSRQWATFHQNCGQENLAKVKRLWGLQAAVQLDTDCKRNRPQ
jgi:hypothetical protein